MKNPKKVIGCRKKIGFERDLYEFPNNETFFLI